MKKTLALAFALGVAACGEEPSIAPAAQAAAPKALTVAAEEKPDADGELAKRVGRALEDAKLHGVDIVAAKGIVTLWGTAVSPKEKARAAEIARHVEGVEAVENRLEVVAGS